MPPTKSPRPARTSRPAARITLRTLVEGSPAPTPRGLGAGPGSRPPGDLERAGDGSGRRVLVLPVGRCRLGRAPAVEVAQVRLEVGPQTGAVLPLEGPQLLDLALEAAALLLETAHGLAVPALGVLLQGGGLRAGLALHRLGARAGLADHRLGAVLRLRDHLLTLR